MIVILKRKDRISYIISKAVIHYGIPRDKMLGYVRKRSQLERKHFIIKLLRDIADLTFKEIANVCHSDVSCIHDQLTRLNEDLSFDEDMKNRYNYLEHKILTNT